MSKKNKLKILKLIVLITFLLFSFVLGCSLGKHMVSFKEVVETFFGGGTEQTRLIIFQIRMPRVILSILVGIGMGMSGVVMQNLLHNELASPGTLGVSAGSGLFVTVYIALFKKSSLTAIMLPILAMTGGITAAILIFVLSVKRKSNFNTNRIIMTGIALSAGYGAIATFMMMLIDQNKLEFLQRWNSGELWGTEWRYIEIFSIWLLFFSIAIYSKAKKINIINLGYDTSKSLGINISREFIMLSLSAVALSSSSVAFGGNFFFLGLIGPHIARKVIGEDAKFLLPASSIISALIILFADILIRNLSLFSNIPTGIVISILSVPYFIYLLIKK